MLEAGVESSTSPVGMEIDSSGTDASVGLLLGQPRGLAPLSPPPGSEPGARISLIPGISSKANANS